MRDDLGKQRRNRKRGTSICYELGIYMISSEIWGTQGNTVYHFGGV